MIPIGDSPRSRTTPWVNYVFILINIGVFIYVLLLSSSIPGSRRVAEQDFLEQHATVCYGLAAPPTEVDRFYCEWGLQSREFVDALQGEGDLGGQDSFAVLATIVTSMFLHAGWLHLFGNMLFLWVFGDNVEDRLGHVGYVLFYLAGGIVASLTQVAIDVDSLIPIVGASGAVAAVLGAYLFFFPRATVNIIIPFFILIFIPIPVPAVIMIGLWFLQQLLAGVATLGEVDTTAGGGVAFFAHIGGFLFGAAMGVLLRPFLRRAPRYR